MKIAIAAFAKTIGFSPVKTRLAEDKGKEFAEGFYHRSVAATREVLLTVCDEGRGDISAYWAVAEEEAANRNTWPDLPVMWTGKGSLGHRLANIYGQLFEDHDAVFLMGTDSPQIRPDQLNVAFKKLAAGEYPCVAGPAVDGGFYLFGGRIALGRDVWTSVEYSRGTTLKELVAVLEKHGHETGFMTSLEDVDTESSLDVLVQSLKSDRQVLLPAQLELLDWLEENHCS